jgi:hypothetical protein
MAAADADQSARQVRARGARRRHPLLSIADVAREYRGLRTLPVGRREVPASQSAVSVRSRSLDVRSSLPRGRARVPFLLLKERLLDLAVDADEPRLRARGPVAEMSGLGLGLSQPFFGCAELE